MFLKFNGRLNLPNHLWVRQCQSNYGCLKQVVKLQYFKEAGKLEPLLYNDARPTMVKQKQSVSTRHFLLLNCNSRVHYSGTYCLTTQTLVALNEKHREHQMVKHHALNWFYWSRYRNYFIRQWNTISWCQNDISAPTIA